MGTANRGSFTDAIRNAIHPSAVPMVAGFWGGLVSTTLLLPLDIIKVRLQVSESTKKRRFRGLRIMGGILKYEGVRGLYTGWTPAVFGSSISWGGYFYFYEGLKVRLLEYKTLHSEHGALSELNSMDNFVLACVSGAIMVGLTNPVWLIKTRMQLQMRRASEQHHIRPYANMVDAFRTIVREEGALALYRGSGPALLLTSHGGVQFVVYEYLRKQFHYRRMNREDGRGMSVWHRLELSAGYLGMGAIAKLVATTATYPLQLIKSRMQQRSESVELTEEGQTVAVRRKYRSMINTARRIHRLEGFLGFFKGCIPNAIRVAPGAAITFVVYEEIRDILSD